MMNSWIMDYGFKVLEWFMIRDSFRIGCQGEVLYYLILHQDIHVEDRVLILRLLKMNTQKLNYDKYPQQYNRSQIYLHCNQNEKLSLSLPNQFNVNTALINNYHVFKSINFIFYILRYLFIQ